LEKLAVDGRIEMDRKEMGWKGVDWFHLNQGRDWWWALVNTVMNIMAPYKAENFLSMK
jgi:hypothetical protein